MREALEVNRGRERRDLRPNLACGGCPDRVRKVPGQKPDAGNQSLFAEEVP